MHHQESKSISWFSPMKLILVASQPVKDKAYLTYVCPKLEFASTLWNPYHQKDIQTIEMVQHRATHFVTNTYNYYSKVTTIIS